MMYREDLLWKDGGIDNMNEVRPPKELQVDENRPLTSFASDMTRGGMSLPIMIIIALAIGAGIGWQFGGLIRAGAALQPGLGGWLALLLMLFFALATTLAVHQGGHLLGALLAGFRFSFFVLGPLKIMRDERGLLFTLNRNPALYTGAAGAVPSDARELRFRTLEMVIGGPLASFLLGLLALGIYNSAGYRIGTPPTNMGAALGSTYFLLTMAFSFGLGILTLLPVRSAEFFADGARLRILFKDAALAERWSAIGLLLNAAMGGLRPREWNPGLVRRAVSLPDGTPDDLVASSYAYYRDLDAGDIMGAQKFLQRMITGLERLPADLRPNIMLEAAYFVARYYRNATVASAWLKRARGGSVEEGARLRAEATVLLIQGKHDEARALAMEGLVALKLSSYAGIAHMEEDWLREVLRETESA